MDTEKEAILEAEETTDSEKDTESQTTSEEQELEGTKKDETEQPEGEKAEGGGKKTYSETEFTAAVEREAQSRKDKELKSIYTRIEAIEKEREDLKRKLETREDDRELNLFLSEETEKDGEETAKKRDEIRRKWAARYREFQDGSQKVTEKEKSLETLAEKLGGIERTQRAKTEALKMLLPQDKTLISDIDAIVKRLEEAETPREFDLVLKAIQSERTAGKKPFTPDSSKSGPGPGINPNKLTPDEKITLGLRKLKKK